MDVVANGNGHQDAARDTGGNLDDPVLRDMAAGAAGDEECRDRG